VLFFNVDRKAGIIHRFDTVDTILLEKQVGSYKVPLVF
jgi:hypothetical protein